jgi:predicted small metal-binding protein
MKQGIASLVLVLVLAFAVSATAQDKMMKKDAMKAKDHAMMKAGEMKSNEAGTLKTFSCGDPCNFSVTSRDQKELTATVMAHVKKHHNMDMTEQQIMEHTKDAEPMKKME